MISDRIDKVQSLREKRKKKGEKIKERKSLVNFVMGSCLKNFVIGGRGHYRQNLVEIQLSKLDLYICNSKDLNLATQ
jgi:hypothetical protein